MTTTTNVFAPILAPAGTPHSLARDMGIQSIVVAKALMNIVGGYHSGCMFTPMSAVQLGTLRLAAARVQRERDAEAARVAAWRAANPEAAAFKDAEDAEYYAALTAEYATAA